MTTSKLLKSLMIAALVACVSAHAAEQTIVVAHEEGKQVATFKLGDASCVLKDDQIRCAPANK